MVCTSPRPVHTSAGGHLISCPVRNLQNDSGYAFSVVVPWQQSFSSALPFLPKNHRFLWGVFTGQEMSRGVQTVSEIMVLRYGSKVFCILDDAACFHLDKAVAVKPSKSLFSLPIPHRLAGPSRCSLPSSGTSSRGPAAPSGCPVCNAQQIPTVVSIESSTNGDTLGSHNPPDRCPPSAPPPAAPPPSPCVLQCCCLRGSQCTAAWPTPQPPAGVSSQNFVRANYCPLQKYPK